MNFRFGLNSIASVAEVLINALALFILYRLVLSHLGVASLGLWSLVLSTTSLARLGDMGAAAGLSRFIAASVAQGDRSKAKRYLDTALVANLLLYVVIGLVVYFPLYYGIGTLVPTDRLGDAHRLVPYALASFLCLNLSGVMSAGLIAMQSAYLKSAMSILSTLVQIAVAALLVPKMGLTGIALGQISQYAFILAVGWILFGLRVNLGLGELLQIRFRLDLLKEIFGFGVKLQAANIANFLFEPLTKAALGKIFGLETLGLFEMAYKVAWQARNIIAAPTIQTLLPAYSHILSLGGDVRPLYEKATSLTLISGMVGFLSVMIISPGIGYLWTGRIDITFVTFTVTLCCGWFLNTVSNPAYFLGLSTGRVGNNLVGHLITSFGSPVLGFCIGLLTGPVGYVVGVSVALAAGASYSMVTNCRLFAIPPLPTVDICIESILSTFGRLAKNREGA